MPTKKPGTKPLNPKQVLFVQEYLKDLNARAAARRAGYSPASVKTIGPRLLAMPHVAAAIEAAQAASARRNDLSVDRILEELKILGFSDIAHYLKFPGEGETGDPILDFTQIPAGGTRAIQQIVQETYLEGHGDDAVPVKRTKFRLHPKIPAIDLLMKHLGMLVQRRYDLPIPLDQMTEDQLRRIADGADPLIILAESRGAG